MSQTCETGIRGGGQGPSTVGTDIIREGSWLLRLCFHINQIKSDILEFDNSSVTQCSRLRVWFPFHKPTQVKVKSAVNLP